MERRILMTGGVITLAAPSLIIPNRADALIPIVGIFARTAVSMIAKRAARRLMTRTVRPAIRRPQTRATLTPTVRRQADETQDVMARNGGFTRIQSEIAGEVAGEIAQRIVENINSPQVAAIHAENPTQDGEHGPAQCVGITNIIEPTEPSIMIESPEIIAMDGMRSKATEVAPSEDDVAQLLLPTRMIQDGKFSYADGHSRPTLFQTVEGTVELTSFVEGRTGVLRAAFAPNRTSRWDPFFSVVEV